MSAQTLIDQFEQRVSESGDAVALRYHADGAWQDVSFAEWLRTSTLLAAGLVHLGVETGDRVAILSSTRIEWVYADQAVLLSGGVVVPVYETMRPRQARIIIDDSGASVVFVEDPVQLEKLLRVLPELPHVRWVIYFDELARLRDVGEDGRTHRRMDDLTIDAEWADRVVPLSRVRELGAKALGADPNAVGDRRRQVNRESLASIVYTSGTTGRPRGVALTHGAFVAQVEGNKLALPLGPDDEQVLFLPLAQILARAIYLTAMSAGCVNTFSRGYAWLADDLEDINPTLLVAVPRVFDTIWTRVNKSAVAGGALRRRLRDGGITAARAKSAAREGRGKLTVLDRVRLKAADVLLFSPLRRVFGNRFKYAVSGGAPMPIELMEIYDGAGIPILEGYGLTEHCAAVCVNRLDDYRVGTVGKPLEGVELRIAADGEILVRSECIMRSYWKDPESSTDALAGAWLHTGDIGELVGNHLRLTDRKKDVIVTANGRVVSPMPIESMLQAVPYIEHAVVHGESRRFLSALVTLNETAVRRWAKGTPLEKAPLSELSQDPSVFALLSEAIEGVNAELPGSETVKKFAILQGDFSLESGELTATWATRRKFVTTKYASILDALYE